MCFAETPIFFSKSRARTHGGANKAKSGAPENPPTPEQPAIEI
jgi:hypothetical protein